MTVKSAAAIPPCTVLIDRREPYPGKPGERERIGIVPDEPEEMTQRRLRDSWFLPTVLVGPPNLRTLTPLPWQATHLVTGDYSLIGRDGEALDHVVAIERKSEDDMIGTLFGCHLDSVGERVAESERFRAECERLAAIRRAGGFAWIVVESTIARIERREYRGGPAPDRVLAALMAIQVDYGIPIEMRGSKMSAEHWVGWTLARIHAQATGGQQAKDARARGVAGFLPWMAPVVDPRDVDEPFPRTVPAEVSPTTANAGQRAQIVVDGT